jgi:membrane protein implicated in regulation of membrane protease activity
MPRSPIGLLFILAGLVLVGVGLLVWSGGLSWFGRLPGDIRIERPTTRIYVPIVSSLVLSIVVSLVGAILRRFR